MTEEEAPALPGEAEEAAFLAGERPQEEEPGPGFPPPAEMPKEAPLPSLDDLVGRIPPSVRTALDELFRARFTGVRRASEKDLGAQTS